MEALKKSGLRRRREKRGYSRPSSHLPAFLELRKKQQMQGLSSSSVSFIFFFFFLLHLVPTIILSLIQSAVAALYFIEMTKMVIGIFNQGKACYIHSRVPALGHTVLHIQVHMSDSFLCLKYVHGCITSCLTQQIKTLVIRICESSSV